MYLDLRVIPILCDEYYILFCGAIIDPGNST
jgi:hypothetical protein